MSAALFGVSSGFCCCLTLFGQAPSGAIAGVVTDRGSNTPLRRAIVTLSTLEAQPQDAVAWTDANGRFGFGYLPAGRYELRVTKNGYQPSTYGTEDTRRLPRSIQLAAGEVRNDLVFRMQLVNSVSGLIVDEDGDPVAGIQILAMRQGWQRQKRELLPGPAAMSDSSGRYRITGLPPGSYAFVAAGANRPALKLNPEVSAGPAPPRYMYGEQYYPGTDQAASARLTTVEAGREYSQIDFRLTAQPVTSVQGKVVLPAGVKTEQVSINAGNADLWNRMNFGTGVSNPDHVFRFDQFPPGSYTLVAQATAEGKQYRGVQKIEVGPEGARDLAIALEAGIDLQGSVSVEGPDAGKFPAAFVTLVPGDGISWTGPQLRANAGKEGRFTLTGVPPGVWDINAGPVPPGGYIKSMYLGDQDVLTEEMVIRATTSAQLKIVLGTQGASLSGDVNGEQPGRSAVLAAPDGKFRHVLSFYRYAVSDGQGHFQIKGMRPGNYKLYAFEEFDPQSIQDPEFLAPFEPAGIAVTLREGENPAQKLRVIPAANAGHTGGTP